LLLLYQSGGARDSQRWLLIDHCCRQGGMYSRLCRVREADWVFIDGYWCLSCHRQAAWQSTVLKLWSCPRMESALDLWGERLWPERALPNIPYGNAARISTRAVDHVWRVSEGGERAVSLRSYAGKMLHDTTCCGRTRANVGFSFQGPRFVTWWLSESHDGRGSIRFSFLSFSFSNHNFVIIAHSSWQVEMFDSPEQAAHYHILCRNEYQKHENNNVSGE
jgi:hypothetical protein